MGYISVCILPYFSEGTKKKRRLNFMLKSVHGNQCKIVKIRSVVRNLKKEHKVSHARNVVEIRQF
jgi:hypothetical protein